MTYRRPASSVVGQQLDIPPMAHCTHTRTVAHLPASFAVCAALNKRLCKCAPRQFSRECNLLSDRRPSQTGIRTARIPRRAKLRVTNDAPSFMSGGKTCPYPCATSSIMLEGVTDRPQSAVRLRLSQFQPTDEAEGHHGERCSRRRRYGHFAKEQ